MKRIYLDYASLTPIDPRALREMKRYSSAGYANPSSIYMEGVAAKRAMDDARSRIARLIHAHPDEIVFTSGGTEANGLALEGAARAAVRSGNAAPHLVISAVEHSSVMELASMFERQGTQVTRLPVGRDGCVSPEDLKKALRTETFMVSIMTVNNETGSIQPIRDLMKAVRAARRAAAGTKEGAASAYPLFHTDAAQAAAHMDLNVEQLGVDLMTLDGGKIYGPRGCGALYVRRGTPIEPILYGGGQEGGLRSGTENVPAIMGFARALELASDVREEESRRLAGLRDVFCRGLREVVPGAIINADPLRAAPNILNVSIPGIDNEYFVLQLDAAGIAVSTRSSCLRDADESYVLAAMGADSATSVRFSFGRWTKPRDVAETLRIIAKILKV